MDSYLKGEMILPDLIDGLVCALAERGETSICFRDKQFYAALAGLQDSIESEAKTAGFHVSFYMLLDPVDGTSEEIEQAIHKATQTDVVSLDNPTYVEARCKVTKETAIAGYSGLPGSPHFYRRLAEKYLSNMSAAQET